MHRLNLITGSCKDTAYTAGGMCRLNDEEYGNIVTADRHMTECHIHGHDLQTKDEQTENAMLAYYFKKQEEQKVSSLPQTILRDKVKILCTLM